MTAPTYIHPISIMPLHEVRNRRMLKELTDDMKKKSRHVQIWKLPNHSWLPPDSCPQGSRCDNPKIVIRRTGSHVLVRDRAWNEEIRCNNSKSFCGENRPNETWDSMDLYIWGDSAIEILGQKAKDGNAAAAQELWRLAVHATGLLTQVCKTKPEFLRPVARMNRQWPVFKRKDAKLTADEKSLFNAIQLGRDDFVELRTGKAKWKFDDAGKIAYSLLYYIRKAREDVGSLTYGRIGELIREKLPYDFDDEGVDEWWEVAKAILLSVYPKPHAVDELKNLTPATEAGRKKSPGVIDQDIFRALKNRLKAFAP